ncbi:GDSL-type esterase/lipase family protein [Mucilaginibacter daejeonensis]|uniref:GDSL-type esterase/lipase family protein n=1 Tax=Mucilaginibacter daejeonensis TaxID=398049 RepID=UPI001D1744F3|nr:GDSL-type esterase/lipase family protein [Mucilaginibacter daejeonensis]UEG54128.1 GDSL-type esterase/lipase family protein [Mucilaginibacter daejeonensis]
MFWYEEEVKGLERNSLKIGYAPETLFYGSSSIRLWSTLYQDFADLKPVNLGFGGSTLAACVWFFDRIMMPYQPKRLIVYAGDNDLGDGRHPEEVLIFFQQLVVRAQERFGDMPCYFVSLKPSPARWSIADSFKYTNNLIENEIVKQQNNWRFINIFKAMLDPSGKPQPDHFADDALHLSAKGYEVWKQVIRSSISS